jgi:hypothetical protein
MPTPTSAHAATSQSTPISAQPPSATSEYASGEQEPLNLALYDWDFDFEGAIWPKANEPVDPNLSLGQIVWHPAEQVTRALPSSAIEAQKQADDPAAKKLDNAESVSMYFTADNSHEAFLDIRQTDDWEMIKEDPVFVVFTDEMMANFIPIEECIALRDRPDEPIEDTEQEVKKDEAMQDSSWDVMNDLEQALSGNAETEKASSPLQHASRSKEQVQEDILAKLGVTGRPKTPTNEIVSLPHALSVKPPSSLPPRPPAPPSNRQVQSSSCHLGTNFCSIPPRPIYPPSRSQSYSERRNFTNGAPAPRPFGSISSTKPPLPGSRLQDVQRFQNQHNVQAFDVARESPARSEGSNHTMAGSDFESAKTEQTVGAVPQLKRSDSSFARKRSYEESDHEDQKTHQPDDHARRKRRSQVAPAYR